ncbi:hypothetical protein PIB30_033189 [Stylosanthes scabra]|uniref:Uncharacterized protein n=1 Tax=Stylosanthes scabra TaxID=79078 RepID=A0ABU6QC38_9FABA|nr:hypothetical protein [Stylosanthes scabra]
MIGATSPAILMSANSKRMDGFGRRSNRMEARRDAESEPALMIWRCCHYDVMDKFAITVLNVSGRLGTDENDVLKYIDRVKQSFAALDVEFLNISDLEVMAKTLGYPSYTAMH